MPKDKLTEYSATNASNTDVGGVNIDEGMLPSAVNNALRELLTHLKEFSDGTSGIDVLSLADDDASAAMKLQAPASVTSDTTLTLPDGDGADGQALITNGSGTLAWAYPYGNRNLIINGAMQVAQRSTSVTGITGSDYHTMDRWKIDLSNLGTWSFSQSSTAPDGFANSYKLDCTTADASPAAGDYLILQQRFEGQNLQMLKKGTSAAESVTVSFSIRSSVTGTYTCELYDDDNARYVGKTFTVDSANTWERKAITFPGDTTGTLNDDSNLSFFCQIWFGAGSNFNGGTFNNGTWGAGGNNTRVSSSNVNLASSTSNEAYVTAWQMEVGETATPFEHRSFADELQRCQRYYFALQAPIAANGRYYSGAFQGNYQVHRNFHVQMRTSPTATASHTNVDNTSSMSLNQSKSGGVGLTGSITNTAFQYCMFIDTSTYDAEL